MRAHNLHASRSPALETVVGSVCFPRLTRSLRRHPAESSRVRVRVFPLRLSASASGLGSHRHPPPPNNSFKPTPCRGVGRVLCATLARIRRPATGRLNSGVRRQKKHSFSAALFLLSCSAHFRSVAVFSCCACCIQQSCNASDSSSGALKAHKRCVRPLRKQWLVRSVFRD